MIFTKPTPEDRHRIYEIHMSSTREACSPAYSSIEIEAMCKNKTPDGYLSFLHEMLVAKHSERIIGWIHASNNEIHGLFVDPIEIGKGIGSLLVEQARMKMLKDAKTIKLESGINAVNFYKKIGFKELTKSFIARAGMQIPVVTMELKC